MDGLSLKSFRLTGSWGRGRICGVGPIAVSGGDFELVAGGLEADGVQARVRRLWLEAQHVAVRDVVGDGGKVAFEALRIGELEILATGDISRNLH